MMLLVVGCQKSEIDDNEQTTKELKFSPSVGQAQSISRAVESDNSVLQTASAAGVNSPHIVIETYTGTPGSSLKEHFSDKLGYLKSGSWDVCSGIPRFLPVGGMNLYAYFATNGTGKGDLSNVDYSHPSTEVDLPELSFTVPTNDALNQVDLIAAKVEGIKSNEIQIPFRHILSQINFGVKGLKEHQITIKNIRINNVNGKGTFNYKKWQWTVDNESSAQNHPYYFPDRRGSDQNSGLGENYQTRGTAEDDQNIYIFGDGGKFGPGKDATYLYAQVNPTPSNYATQDKTITSLNNSLMLLPQEITKNSSATVTLDYQITSNGQTVSSAVNYAINLDDYYDWQPNLRYVYLFNFEAPFQKVTFDVVVEEWENYNGGNGIVGTEELNGNTLFEKHVRKMQSGGKYSVPIGPLSNDFICDWSLYALDNNFMDGQQFTLSFDSSLPFINGKSVKINPPFGFTTSTSSISAPTTVTFTAIHSYYTTLESLNAAISSGIGNYEFSISDNIKLNEINFKGSTSQESSLTIHYPSPYTGSIPDRWQMYDNQTAVYFPTDYALTGSSAPYSYKVYTVQGLRDIFNWINNGGANPGGTNATLNITERMNTNIDLVANGSYNLALVYKSSSTDTKPAFTPIGNPTNAYSGTFNGNGATVSNLYINEGYTNNVSGFFGALSGTVRHLKMNNLSVTSTGNWTVGGLIGLNKGTVQGCSVQGAIQGTGGVTGAIAGQNDAFIHACASTATVNGSSNNVGGITGYNGGQVWSCYATNDKNVVGVNGNTVLTSYYVASSDIGSIAGSTRVPSIASLNGKVAQLNATILYVPAHFVSGNLNATTPSIAVGSPSSPAGGGVLKGTFIQNWFAIYWDQDRWNEEMAVLATVGMEYLVLDQVMEYSDYGGNEQYMSWYPATKGVLVNDTEFLINWGTALEKCLSACRTHGIKLFVGTFFDKRYWNDGAAVTNSAKWGNCITTANSVMDELIKFYFNGSSSTVKDYTDVLAGWYFPYEVDDFHFQTAPAQTILKDGIRSVITKRNNTSQANKPYLFSPFMNGTGRKAISGTMNPSQYAALWKDIMTSAGFRTGDILSPQDCIGIEKLTIAELGSWMSALKGATTPGVEFWVNVELFGPGANVTFLTGQQIPASKTYAEKFISFSYPIHYSPNSGKGDHKAYKTYYDAQ